MWKILKIAGITIAVIALLVIGAILGLTNTDFGRERVRRIAVSAMNKSIHGTTRIGRVDGDLLRGITLRDVSITDSAGAPFFASPLVQARYTLAQLPLEAHHHRRARRRQAVGRARQEARRRVELHDAVRERGHDEEGHGDARLRLVDHAAQRAHDGRPHSRAHAVDARRFAAEARCATASCARRSRGRRVSA